MQWEIATYKGGEVFIEGKNPITKVAYKAVEYLEWAKEIVGPIAMSYVQNKGWVSEELGPKSGHWKRLAR